MRESFVKGKRPRGVQLAHNMHVKILKGNICTSLKRSQLEHFTLHLYKRTFIDESNFTKAIYDVAAVT